MAERLGAAAAAVVVAVCWATLGEQGLRSVVEVRTRDALMARLRWDRDRIAIVCRGCQLDLPDPAVLLGPKTLRGVSSRHDDGSFFVADETMPLPLSNRTSLADARQRRGLELPPQAFFTRYQSSPSGRSLYYNGDSDRHGNIVAAIEQPWGRLLSLAACNGRRSRANLWVAFGGVTVQTHYDTVENVLLHTAGGFKEVLLVAQSDNNILAKPFLHVHSRHASGYPPWFAVDAGWTSLTWLIGDAYWRPLSGPRWSHVLLAPGDALYIPPMMWHSIRTGNDTSMSLSVFCDSPIDVLAEATQVLPFDPNGVNDSIRSLAMYTDRLIDTVITESQMAALFVAQFREELLAGWSLDDKINQSLRAIPACGQVWRRARTQTARKVLLPLNLVSQVEDFIATTKHLWSAVIDEAVRERQLRVHLETVVWAAVSAVPERANSFFHHCLRPRRAPS